MPKLAELPLNGAVTDASSFTGVGGQGGGRFAATALRDYIVASINATVSLSNAAPAALGPNALAGSATTAARADHVHPRPGLAELGAAPASHTHEINGVNGLSSALAGKAALDHSHAISGVTNLQSALDAKQDSAAKGQPNGFASLGSDGRVPSGQLPPASGGTATPLSDSAPPALAATGAAGTSTSASRADHTHARPTAAEIGALGTGVRGAANGVASLGSDAKVPMGQLAAAVANGLATLDSTGKLTAAQAPPVTLPSNVVTTSQLAAVENFSSAYTAAQADANKVKRCTASAAVTVTLPALSLGTTIRFIQAGTGKVSFVGSGATVNALGGLTSMAGQYANVTATVDATGAWNLAGSLAA